MLNVVWIAQNRIRFKDNSTTTTSSSISYIVYAYFLVGMNSNVASWVNMHDFEILKAFSIYNLQQN